MSLLFLTLIVFTRKKMLFFSPFQCLVIQIFQLRSKPIPFKCSTISPIKLVICLDLVSLPKNVLKSQNRSLHYAMSPNSDVSFVPPPAVRLDGTATAQ